MKRSWFICWALAGIASAPSYADEVLLPYESFGPQVFAHEVIGMQWWQWQPQGGSVDREYPIQVVVYGDQSLEETKAKYPVDPTQEKDFRYLPRTRAISYLEALVTNLESDFANLESTDRLIQTLNETRAKIAENSGLPANNMELESKPTLNAIPRESSEPSETNAAIHEE
ncbi:MAG: hypothetical protein AAF191_13210 [Verrucomicrobiota bacterium]